MIGSECIDSVTNCGRRGLWVAPVDYPAVPQNRICFRACVTAKHTRADLDEALNILDGHTLAALQTKRPMRCYKVPELGIDR